MHDIREGSDGTGLRVGIAVASYNATITDGLLGGAIDAARDAGVADDDIVVVRVPGALEVPLAVAQLARSKSYDAVLALGAVILGETDHYTYVCSETMRGCGEISLETGVPVGFGILTCRTLLQARDRSSTPTKNKGREALVAALAAARTKRALDALHGGTP